MKHIFSVISFAHGLTPLSRWAAEQMALTNLMDAYVPCYGVDMPRLVSNLEGRLWIVEEYGRPRPILGFDVDQDSSKYLCGDAAYAFANLAPLELVDARERLAALLEEAALMRRQDYGTWLNFTNLEAPWDVMTSPDEVPDRMRLDYVPFALPEAIAEQRKQTKATVIEASFCKHLSIPGMKATLRVEPNVMNNVIIQMRNRELALTLKISDLTCGDIVDTIAEIGAELLQNVPKDMAELRSRLKPSTQDEANKASPMLPGSSLVVGSPNTLSLKCAYSGALFFSSRSVDSIPQRVTPSLRQDDLCGLILSKRYLLQEAITKRVV